LDADFVLSSELIDEIEGLQPIDEVCGYRAPFVFCVNGRRTRSSVCPPVTFLYRRESGHYTQDGHTQKLELAGRVVSLFAPIVHDDRKSLARWLKSQDRYARLEAEKILKSPRSCLDFPDRIRRLRLIAPVAMWFYCMLIRGGVLDGRAGLYYACQRMLAE